MRAAYHGSKSSNDDLRRCSLELRNKLLDDLKLYPLMTTTSIGKVISVQDVSLDVSGKPVYLWDGALCIKSKQTGRLLNGDDFYNAMQRLLQTDFNEARNIYSVAIGKEGVDKFDIPTEIGLTLPETSGIVTLGYERASDEGGLYILFNIKADNQKDFKARARGVRVFNTE